MVDEVISIATRVVGKAVLYEGDGQGNQNFNEDGGQGNQYCTRAISKVTRI